MSQIYKGSCFCGAVEIAVTVTRGGGLLPLRVVPELVAAPVNAFSLWKPEAVKVTKGEDNIGVLPQDGEEPPQVLQDVRRHLFTDHPMWS
jgi:hypothetical protein